MRFKLILITLVTCIIIINGCAVFVSEKQKYDYNQMDGNTERIHKKIEAFLESCIEDSTPVKLSKHTRIDSVVIDQNRDHIDIYLNRFFSFIPFREKNTKDINTSIKDELGWWDNNYSFTVHTTNSTTEELIPNYYRSGPEKYNHDRLAKRNSDQPPIVQNISKPLTIRKGLRGKHIALWHSHGWYYESKYNRWE